MKSKTICTTSKRLSYVLIFVLVHLIGISSLHAQTVQVVLGTNNIPITEFKYEYNGSTVTKTSGGGTTVSTTLPVEIISLKVTDGTTKTLDFSNFSGTYIANNNFSASVTGVAVIDSGNLTLATNTTAFEAKMNDVVNGPNLLCALLYDNTTNVPTGDDFDIRFARGLTNDDYIIVGERNGNTHFLVTPLDSVGNVISGASPLHFGNTTGTTSSNGNNKYDWNTTFAPNFSQPMYITVVDVALFGTSSGVYGFRVDNNGDADVKFFGMSDDPFDNNPVNLAVPGVTGNIFNDLDGLTDATVNGSSVDTPSGTQLYVSLVQSGVVIATAAVDSNGGYEFLNISAGTYTTVLHTTSTGSTTSSLPTNWVTTGENDGAGSGNDGTVNGISGSVVVTDSLETQINFAIEQLPNSGDVVASSQSNPGGTTNVTVAATSFSGTDPDSGTPTELRITAFPSNVTTITINGTTYTSGTWPAAGVTVPTNSSGQPTQTITIDPVDGSKTVDIPYAIIDEAGKEDPTPGSVELPFTLEISGNVFNDLDGLEDNTVDGTGINTPSGTQLYANLVDASGNVIDTVMIAADGSYSFDSIMEGTTYRVVLDTLAQTIGGAVVTGGLPSNWVKTGDNIGTGTGDDGTENGDLTVAVGTENVLNINFGIEQLPNSDDKSYTLSTSPVINEVRDLVSSDGMGNLTGSDSEDGTYGSGDNFIITDTTGLNGNELFYDADNDGVYDAGEELYPNDTITNYDPSKLSVKFNGLNSMSFTFNYSWIDAAGLADATPATYAVNWTTPVPVNWLKFTAALLDANTVKLNWLTATELNNSYFEVERFNEIANEFVSVGQVNGAGTTNEIQYYSFIDDLSLTNSEKLVYRMKQVDFDGKFDYSEIAVVNRKLEPVVRIFPIPANNDITISIEGSYTIEQDEEGKYNSARVEMVAMDGRIIESVTVQRGRNSVFNTMDLNTGVYFITVNMNGEVSTRKFLVKH
ncbi:MAG: T9SS type A sorting domain-containing protein [Bacteroidia bacterium]|nr:T9SS type A sorting domain-containing protein [Bacteroidia bacterium]